MELLNIVLLLSACAVAVPIIVLAVECFAAQWLPHSAAGDLAATGRVDVLIPAHNEELVLADTLDALKNELADGDRIWVIADNCDDATADIARRSQVGVFERHDPQRRGKGFALDFAVRQLGEDCDTVVIVDADCVFTKGSLRRLAGMAHNTRRPVQARYTMTADQQTGPSGAISQLAVLVKNVVRPAGLARLGFPCLLTGSGMAFPVEILRDVSLATANLVEDMKLSVDLMLDGRAPMFCEEAAVHALLPNHRQAVVSQRTRWEHGHLQTILSQTPRLLRGALLQRRFDLLIAALDLSIPPLSLLVLTWLSVTLPAILLACLLGRWSAASVSAASAVLLMATAIVAGRKCDSLSLWRTLASVPAYVVMKVPIYARFLLARQTSWVRTSRN